MRNEILKKIDELSKVYHNASIGYGFKTVNGEITDKIGITFGVENKLPLSELNPDEVLPSEIVIDGQVYKTDVIQMGKLQPAICNIPSSCYPYPDINDPYNPALNPAIPNRYKTRPVMGGSGLQIPFNPDNPNNAYGSGTLGFIALEKDSNAYVAVSNVHVLQARVITGVASTGISGSYNLDLVSTFYAGNTKPIGNGDYGSANAFGDPSNTIGRGMFLVRWKTDPGTNETDCGFFLLKEKDTNGDTILSVTESWKQLGLSEITSPPPFATTAELDGMMTPSSPYFNPEVISSGLATGPKNGACGLKIFAIHQSGAFGSNVLFRDVITFTRTNPDCLYPIYSGDSGSAVLAKFGGVWKIIGLAYGTLVNNADEEVYGSLCRIDYIAEQLNIKAWDGTGGRFANTETIATQVSAGPTNTATRILGGKRNWQGMATNQAPTINE
jgi:hypothetical protein